MQYTATHVLATGAHTSVLAATHWCNTLQHTDATHTSTNWCNTLQHAVTRCNTLQHTATHCNTLQHTATRCNTGGSDRSLHLSWWYDRRHLYWGPLQHTALHSTATYYNTLQDTAAHCNTLHHTAPHCNTLQHTATHWIDMHYWYMTLLISTWQWSIHVFTYSRIHIGTVRRGVDSRGAVVAVLDFHMWHDAFICDKPLSHVTKTDLHVTWLLHMSDGLLHMWHDWFTRDMTPSYVTCRIHMWQDWFTRDMTPSYVRWTPSYVTWLFHTWHAAFTRDVDMTHSYCMGDSYCVGAASRGVDIV